MRPAAKSAARVAAESPATTRMPAASVATVLGKGRPGCKSENSEGQNRNGEILW